MHSIAALSEASFRRPFGRPRSPLVRKAIAALDAHRDCQQIVRLLVTYEFPFDIQRSLEIALFHTYGSRSVARLLDRTGELEKHGQKRYDDTRLLIGHFLEAGWNADGVQAIERMNSLHSRFSIPNDDFLFVLWTFIDFPIQWMTDFGWRTFTEHEKLAWFNFWSRIGQRMGIHGIPETKTALDAFVHAYETREFVPSDASARVAQATLNIFGAWWPAPLRPLIAASALSLVRPQLLPAIGVAPPAPWIGYAVRSSLKMRRWIKRYVSLERQPSTIATSLNRTYPENRYTIDALGPAHAVGVSRRGSRDVS